MHVPDELTTTQQMQLLDDVWILKVALQILLSITKQCLSVHETSCHCGLQDVMTY